MDIKEKIEDLVEKITKDDELKEMFEKEPIKAVEKVIDGVKAKLTADSFSKVAGALKKLF